MTVLALARSISAAIQREDGAGALILLRSLMEAAVDLNVLVDDPQHSDRMEASMLDQQARMLRSATDPDIPKTYLSSPAAHPDTPKELEQARSRLVELKAGGQLHDGPRTV